MKDEIQEPKLYPYDGRIDAILDRVQAVVEELQLNDRRQETLLTYSGAAKLLGVSPRKVMRYVKDGDLPVVDLDGSVRIHPKTLQAFIHRKVRR